MCGMAKGSNGGNGLPSVVMIADDRFAEIHAVGGCVTGPFNGAQ